MSELIRCDGCGENREWDGYQCLTSCSCARLDPPMDIQVDLSEYYKWSEAKIQALEKIIKVQDEAISFYADIGNWMGVSICRDTSAEVEDNYNTRSIGGKKARETREVVKRIKDDNN